MIDERQPLVLDQLHPLVALARDQQAAAGGGELDSATDRGAPVGHHFPLRAGDLGDSLFDRAQDRERVFAARIVGGEDRVVGELAGGAAHERALAAIAVAAAAEHDDQASLGQAAHRLQRRAQRAVGVRVVDHHREALAARRPAACVPAPARTWPSAGP